jgi:hypothetical protein
MLDVFLLDVFRRFVLGMLFLLAGLSVCHRLYSEACFVAGYQDNASAGSPQLREPAS